MTHAHTKLRFNVHLIQKTKTNNKPGNHRYQTSPRLPVPQSDELHETLQYIGIRMANLF